MASVLRPALSVYVPSDSRPVPSLNRDTEPPGPPGGLALGVWE